MTFDQTVNYFLPAHIRTNKLHAQYNELRLVASTLVIGIPLVLLFPMLLVFLNRSVTGYLLNGGMLVITLFSVKYLGHYRVPMTLTALCTYFIIYDWTKDSGLIYSTNIYMLHIYLLAAIWVDKKYGWYAIFTNLLLLGFIYHQTLQTKVDLVVHPALGGPLYPLVMNCLITIFFGSFLAWQQYDQERDRAKITTLQNHKITVLDDAVKMRTDQLNSMRETMATDFHDETGNMLSAITRQASLLKLKLGQSHEVKPIVDSIIKNSNSLYASSKDFLWHLNHNSDDPKELFDYLTGYGQQYYNQFDIAFSSSSEDCQWRQFEPSAALNVIFIFKEAMTNIVKHADANEVLLTMVCQSEHIIYSLKDNGIWKQADQRNEHYGLTNMERRCHRNKFGFSLVKTASGTQVEIMVPALNLNQTSR